MVGEGPREARGDPVAEASLEDAVFQAGPEVKGEAEAQGELGVLPLAPGGQGVPEEDDDPGLLPGRRLALGGGPELQVEAVAGGKPPLGLHQDPDRLGLAGGEAEACGLQADLGHGRLRLQKDLLGAVGAVGDVDVEVKGTVRFGLEVRRGGEGDLGPGKDAKGHLGPRHFLLPLEGAHHRLPLRPGGEGRDAQGVAQGGRLPLQEGHPFRGEDLPARGGLEAEAGLSLALHPEAKGQVRPRGALEAGRRQEAHLGQA